MGGYNLSSVECYDPERNEWQAVAPMPGGRAEPCMVALGGKLYVAGGRNSVSIHTTPGTVLSSVECFDPARGTWAAVAPMATARRRCGAAAIGGKMYLAGGVDGSGTLLSSVVCYDPVRDKWAEAEPLPEQTSFGSAVAL